MRSFLKRLLPAPLIAAYHYGLAWAMAARYGFPAHKLTVLAVTGTKGKSSTVEMVNAILEEAGYRTVLASTIRFKIGAHSEPNLFKMTMPGRGFLQKVFAEGVREDCTHAVLEITSEGARQFRHKGIPLNALIFTHIAPEHIESHGSYENYKKAKLSIGWALVHSSKRPRIMVANPEDELGKEFLKLPVDRTLSFSLAKAQPYQLLDGSVSLTFDGVTFAMPFPGEFTILNALAAATLAKELGIRADVIARALSRMKPILGRAEKIERGQPFSVIVDYAHTPGSLEALFKAYAGKRLIGVIGSTGGGRDTWNRPLKGALAEKYCDVSILTDEDPYDENSEKIIAEIAGGFTQKKPVILLDRRKAIARALTEAHPGDVVLITGKGTDPFIMGPDGTKTPWSDARIAAEELGRLAKKDSTMAA